MENNTRFIRLTDKDNSGDIIRQEGRKFYDYDGSKWVRCGISIGYFDPDAPEFDCYEEITETEALKVLGIQ